MAEGARSAGGSHSRPGPSTIPESLVTWLGVHWNGPYSADFLACGDYYGSVSFRLREREVLVDVDPGSWLRTGRLHILVAPRPAHGASAPNRAAPSPAAHHAAAQLSQQGLPVRFEPAGLLAPAQPRLVSRFSAHPAETARLATTAAELVALAELLES